MNRLSARKSTLGILHLGVLWYLLLTFPACQTTSSVNREIASPHDWSSSPSRFLEGSNIIYIGIGEDRGAAQARIKAEAFALQNLANDCSLIPRTTIISPHLAEDRVGVLYRSFAKISVNESECLKGRRQSLDSEVRAFSEPVLTLQLDQYQKTYDAPEAAELDSLTEEISVSGKSQLFVVRQQTTLAKQQIVLDTKGLQDSRPLQNAADAVAKFETANSNIWKSPKAFSDERPNSFNHQPSSVVDSIAERDRISKEYVSTTPLISPQKKKKSEGKRGGGRHSRRGGGGSQPDENSPNPSGQ